MRIQHQILINYAHCLCLLHFLVPQEGLNICWVNIRVVEPCVLGKWASLVAQSLKNLPAVQETQVRSLGWEDPLEKEMATYSSILAWRIMGGESHGHRSLVGYSPCGRKESDTTEQLYFHKCVLLNSDMEKELERIHIYQE